MKLPRLRFADPQVEAAWHAQRDDDVRRPVQYGMLAFAIVLIAGALGDLWQGYAAWERVVAIRAFLWMPIMLTGAWVVSRPALRGRCQDVTMAVSILMTLSLLGVMLVVVPRSTAVDYPMYWTVLLLLVHVVTPIGFARSLVAGSVVVGSFFATMLHHGVDGRHLSSHTVFLLFTWALLITASWLNESQHRQIFVAERQLKSAKEDVERVLRAIVPAHIAERLIRGDVVVVDEVPDATVLFADLAGFTALTREMRAADVVSLLDGVFSEFERLAASHGVDKVKTIGDAFMAVGGTQGEGTEAVARVADLALAMLDAIDAHAKRTGAALHLRIGIHRGPVVAGVVGRSRFSYDLWGDTVNMASRMEASGEAGAIHVSAPVADALHGSFLTRARGPVAIKGVGPVETWWVEGRRA